MSDNVIRLRPLAPIPPGPALVRIDTAVKIGALLRALAAEGLCLHHDARTGDFVILPREVGR